MKGNPNLVDTFHSNADETEFTINTYQDCEPILEENKKSYNNYGDKLPSGKSGDGLRVASIPLNVWQKWKKETNGEIERDSNLLKKYLNDPDNKYFRTTPTRV
jgi:hypothetical protein